MPRRQEHEIEKNCQGLRLKGHGNCSAADALIENVQSAKSVAEAQAAAEELKAHVIGVFEFGRQGWAARSRITTKCRPPPKDITL